MSALFSTSEHHAPKPNGGNARGSWVKHDAKPTPKRPAPPAPTDPDKPAAVFLYCDATGKPVREVRRYVTHDGGKTFKRFHYVGATCYWGDGDTKPLLYRLPELAAADPTRHVFFVEGEGVADGLRSRGFIATTLGGASSPVTAEVLAPLAGRDVVILPDNDGPGRQHGERVATALHGMAASVRVVTLPELPPKGDAVDWFAAGHMKAELIALVEAAPLWSPPADDTSTQPSVEHAVDPWEPPLDFGTPEVSPFPIEALPGELGAYVRSVASATQTPADIAGMLSIASLAACAGGRVEVQIKPGYLEPCNLFVAVVAEPGTRKSAVFSELTKPIVEAERDERERMRGAVAASQSERVVIEGKIADAEKRAIKCQDKDESANHQHAAAELRRTLAELSMVMPPRFFADDATPERLAGLLAEQGGAIALMSAEGGAFGMMAGRYSNGESNLDVYLKGHAGDPLRVDRQKSSELVAINHPALTLGLAIQPDVLRSLDERREFRGRGLTARFLFSLPKSNVGTRTEEAPLLDHALAAWWDATCRRILGVPRNGDPLALTLAQGAHTEWRAFYVDVEQRLAEGRDLHPIADWASKLAGAVARIAGLLHLAAGGGGTVIGESTMDAAVAAGRYLIDHAKAAFDVMGADPEIERARHVRRWAKRNGQLSVTKREVWQGVKGSTSLFTSAADLDRPLRVLAEHGYIRRAPARQGPGRPSERWEVNPYALGDMPSIHKTPTGRTAEAGFGDFGDMQRDSETQTSPVAPDASTSGDRPPDDWTSLFTTADAESERGCEEGACDDPSAGEEGSFVL